LDLRSKLADVRAAEGKAQTNLQKVDISIKHAQTELSAARINLTMLQLTMKASEERFDRDQKLTETRFRMKLLGLETTERTAIKTAEANFEEQQHRFMVSVCERFKEFVDFAAPVSEDSVHERLDRVLNAFQTAGKRLRDTEDMVKELADIRTIVAADRGVSVSRCVSALVKGYQEYQIVRYQIDNGTRAATELPR
jgi:hypothetical protein